VRAFPNDCVGVLHFRRIKGQLGTGTGFLIANDLVLTVAHNIYERLRLSKGVNLSLVIFKFKVIEQYEFIFITS
jgi:V8-like Glu-specific endopeptidase